AAQAAAEAGGVTIEMEVLPDGVAISGRGAPAAVLGWLASVQAEQRLRPLELELAADDALLSIDGRLLAVGSATP
ncbi:MAG: hypothetical protein KDH20_08850, partial [Rhodocyclaceae bacterium]|nr:hypothetical protein [Rhodocyclaceae bacterium]